MDTTIYRDPNALVGTQYIEYGPGSYCGKHWQPGFRFVGEEAFVFAEGVLVHVLPSFDHYGVTDVPAAAARIVAARWRALAAALPTLAPEEAPRALALSNATLQRDAADVARHRSGIVSLLAELADDWDALVARHGKLTVLGL